MGKPRFTLDRANLGQDPEFFEVGRDNTLQCQLNVASTPRYYDREAKEWKNGDTTWIRASAWGWEAEKIDSMQLRKGDTVYIEGSFKENNYTDKDGIERYGYNFTIEKLFLHPKLSNDDFDYGDNRDEDSRTKVKRRDRSSQSSRSSRSSQSSRNSRSSRSSRSSSRKPRGSFRSTRKPRNNSKKQSLMDKVNAQLGK